MVVQETHVDTTILDCAQAVLISEGRTNEVLWHHGIPSGWSVPCVTRAEGKPCAEPKLEIVLLNSTLLKMLQVGAVFEFHATTEGSRLRCGGRSPGTAWECEEEKQECEGSIAIFLFVRPKLELMLRRRQGCPRFRQDRVPRQMPAISCISSLLISVAQLCPMCACTRAGANRKPFDTVCSDNLVYHRTPAPFRQRPCGLRYGRHHSAFACCMIV